MPLRFYAPLPPTPSKPPGQRFEISVHPSPASACDPPAWLAFAWRAPRCAGPCLEIGSSTPKMPDPHMRTYHRQRTTTDVTATSPHGKQEEQPRAVMQQPNYTPDTRERPEQANSPRTTAPSAPATAPPPPTTAPSACTRDGHT